MVLVAGTEHELRPAHAVMTLDSDVDAWHVPRVKLPQPPLGVP